MDITTTNKTTNMSARSTSTRMAMHCADRDSPHTRSEKKSSSCSSSRSSSGSSSNRPNPRDR